MNDRVIQSRVAVNVGGERVSERPQERVDHFGFTEFRRDHQGRHSKRIRGFDAGGVADKSGNAAPVLHQGGRDNRCAPKSFFREGVEL